MLSFLFYSWLCMISKRGCSHNMIISCAQVFKSFCEGHPVRRGLTLSHEMLLYTKFKKSVAAFFNFTFI